MNEKLLQFIWQHRYFNLWNLTTLQQETLEIIQQGRLNPDQGPDFLSGQVRINGQLWAGNVELHVHSSDWELHGHDADSNYDNVVLHVVWKHDKPIRSSVPILELQSRVPFHLTEKYREWMRTEKFIPCSGELASMDKAMVYPFLDWLMLKRVADRSREAYKKVKVLGLDWEEAFWRALARGFGHKVNADAFEALAATLPVKLIMRHSHQPGQLEAMMLGQAGLLRTDTRDEYAVWLFREYSFFRNKYKLDKTYMPVHFLRMRPGNFPTVRLAQLAALMGKTTNLFSIIVESDELDKLRDYFKVTAGTYWDHHYRFGEESGFIQKITGARFIDNLIINTVIPFLTAFFLQQGKNGKADMVANWVYRLSPESNVITGGFEKMGIVPRHMGHSQGLLELKQQYCSQFKCLECAIGKHLLSGKTPDALKARNAPLNT